MDRIPDISLSAQQTDSASDLRVRYTITNKSAGDVYVLDGKRTRNANGEPSVTTSDYSLFPSEPGEAKVLVGIAPLPANKLVAVRIMPVASKLAPGASLSRELQPIPLPLTERTPYITADELRNLQTTTVQRLVLGVQFLRASLPTLVVTPIPFDSTHVDVKTKQTAHDAEEVRVVLQQKEAPLRIVPPPR